MIIVLFHVLYLFGKYVYENYNSRKEKTEDNNMTNQLINVSEAHYSDIENSVHDDSSPKLIVKFFPPVYIQRYNAVQNIIASDPYIGKIHKVIDFGCAELSFAIHLKNTDGIREIYCIDVDRSLLEKCQSKVAPLHCDYLCLRTDPLTIHVCEGSIAHNDNKLANTDAVICIELIEHLYPDDLEAFPRNVFGFIRPLVAIVTTPNADFNILFNLGNEFRHTDHKFEWTRRQFKNWADRIISRYPEYEVSFHGIGTGPTGTENLGTCSQMAVFHRVLESQNERLKGIDGLLKTVVSHEYPYRPDNRSDEEKILDEAVYYIRLFSARHEEMCEEIPLEQLMFSVRKFCISIEILKNILQENYWEIAERENGPVVIIPPRSGFSPNSDADIDDFLDNDYRHHEGDDEWNHLESDAQPPSYSFDRYMERDMESHEEEENWDLEETQNTENSNNSNVNSQNVPNSELLVSENADGTSDSQWTMEDLINEDQLIDASQNQPEAMVDSFGIETELPSNSLSIELDCTDMDCLNISNDTLDSSEHRLSSPFPVPDLSETSQSLEIDRCLSFSMSNNPNLTIESNKIALKCEETSTDSCLKDGKNLTLETDAYVNSISTSKLAKKSIYDSARNNEEPEAEYQTTTDISEKFSADLDFPCHDGSKLFHANPESPCLDFRAIDYVDSLYLNSSSISTIEAEVLISAEQSLLLDVTDRSLNPQKSLGNEEFIDEEKKNSELNIEASSSLNNVLSLENDAYDDLCNLPEQHFVMSNNSLHAQNKASYSSVQDSSSAIKESCKNLDVSIDSIDSYYQKCETEPIDTRIMISERIKSQDSISFKSISNCSLDLHPKYTSSPQISTLIQENYKSNILKTIEPTTSAVKLETEESVENMPLSTSQLSLRSNSDISLSTVTSTGSSNLEKWYAAEANPMYQQDVVVLKGGNDTSDNPNDETASDSDATVSDGDRGRNTVTNKDIDLRSKRSNHCNRKKKSNHSPDNSNEDIADDVENIILCSNHSIDDKTNDKSSCESSELINSNAENITSNDVKDKKTADKNWPNTVVEENIKVAQNVSGNTNDSSTSSDAGSSFVNQDVDQISDVYKVTKTLAESTQRMLEKVDATEHKLESTSKSIEKISNPMSKEDKVNMYKNLSELTHISHLSMSFPPMIQKTDDTYCLSLDHAEQSSGLRTSGFLKGIEKSDFSTFDILNTLVGKRRQLQSTVPTRTLSTNNEGSTSSSINKIAKETRQSKSELDLIRGSDNVESQQFSPESLDTPPNSWSPEIMDSGYPNSASVQDITPEYELSSIANDRISDSDSASIGEEVPVPGFYENVEVENGDLANNNRDDEGNNVIAFDANDDLDDLQPLIDVLENDMENENDIYVLQNGFPMWLLRILEMANPIDIEARGIAQAQLYPGALDRAGGDAPNINADNDEGFDSSSSDDDSDSEDDEADDVTTISSDETEDPSAEDIRRDWRAGGDP